jgi:hypothetical protein
MTFAARVIANGADVFSGSLVAGDNLSGGSGNRGFVSGNSLGSLTPNTFLGGTINTFADQYALSAYQLSGFAVTTAVDPGKFAVSRIVSNGVTWNITSSTTYTYSGGIASWNESINGGLGFSFVGGNTYNPSKVNQ